MNRREQLANSVPRHPAPLVVVDNGSVDGSPETVAAARPDADVVRLDHNIGAVARNVGVERAPTPYVAFADDDSWWAPGDLERAADLLDAFPRLAVLAARVLIGPEERVDPFCAELAASPLPPEPDLPGPSILGFLACAVVVRREAFLQVGGFDPVVGFLGEEERVALDLAAAGWGMAYVDALTVHHHPLPSGRDVHARRRLQERNALLTAWMRRPLRVAAARTASAVRHGGADGRAATVAAARRLPRALVARKVVPPHVEAALARLE
jgi:GT2 family glycosyltransferase